MFVGCHVLSDTWDAKQATTSDWASAMERHAGCPGHLMAQNYILHWGYACCLQVWFAVKLLERLGQHKTARRLKYGHMAWEIQNSAKTDR